MSHIVGIIILILLSVFLTLPFNFVVSSLYYLENQVREIKITRSDALNSLVQELSRPALHVTCVLSI